jgi:hypothetical protein
VCLRRQFSEPGFRSNHEKRLRRIAEQVVELTARGARIHVAAIRQERERAGASNGVEKPHAEPCLQRLEQQPDAANRHTLSPQLGENHQLQQIHR